MANWEFTIDTSIIELINRYYSDIEEEEVENV